MTAKPLYSCAAEASEKLQVAAIDVRQISSRRIPVATAKRTILPME
jgi:hypothetical protein